MNVKSISIFAMFSCTLTTMATATTFPTATTPFSQYGQIQNVQNYSSNPFWNPDSPYNQRMPVPVYVTGADVDTSDCTAVVGALVASFCASRNNCANMDVNDARPTLTVQLASLPNHNYVTPCAGYIDTEFEKYVSQHVAAAPSGIPVAFPGATTPNSDLNKQQYEFQNPYAPQLPTWNGEPWMQDMLERKQELENLQASTGAGETKLARAEFPKTAADLSFTQQMELDAAGYAPYKDASAYEQMGKIKAEKEDDKRGYSQNNGGDDSSVLTKIKDFFTGDDGNKDGKKGENKGEKKNDHQDDDSEDPDPLVAAPIHIETAKVITSDSRDLEKLMRSLSNCQTGTSSIQNCIANLSNAALQQLEYLPVGESINPNIPLSSWWQATEINDPYIGKKVRCTKNAKVFCFTKHNPKRGDVVYGLIRKCLDNELWANNCIPGYCNSEIQPISGTESKLVWTPDPQNVCWRWDCPDGYEKLSTGQCVNITSVLYLYNKMASQLSSETTGKTPQEIESAMSKIYQLAPGLK